MHVVLTAWGEKSHVKMSGFQHPHPEFVSCMTYLWEEEELIRVQAKALVLLEVFLSWCVCRGACHDVPSHRLPVGIPNITLSDARMMIMTVSSAELYTGTA